MFYPAPSLNEIMPDVLVSALDRKMSSNHKTRMGYFTRSCEVTSEISETETTNKSLKMIAVESTYEATKGVLPTDMMMHPLVEYNYRGENVILNGMDNASNEGVVNNGTWRP
jgi:hypothetical protein